MVFLELPKLVGCTECSTDSQWGSANLGETGAYGHGAILGPSLTGVLPYWVVENKCYKLYGLSTELARTGEPGIMRAEILARWLSLYGAKLT